MAGLTGRLFFLMIYKADYYSEMAEDLHQRERTIKAARGRILDRNGVVIADNRTVCTISVVHNQIEDPESVIRILSGELGVPEDTVRKKVEKYSAREIIKTNVDRKKETRFVHRDLPALRSMRTISGTILMTVLRPECLVSPEETTRVSSGWRFSMRNI